MDAFLRRKLMVEANREGLEDGERAHQELKAHKEQVSSTTVLVELVPHQMEES